MEKDALNGWTPEQTRWSNLVAATLVLCMAAYLAWSGLPNVALFFIGVAASLFCRTFFHLSLVFILMSAGIGFIVGLPS